MDSWTLGLLAKQIPRVLQSYADFLCIINKANEKSKVTALGNLSATLMAGVCKVTALERVPKDVYKTRDKLVWNIR